jgi:hypothetical protein
MILRFARPQGRRRRGKFVSQHPLLSLAGAREVRQSKGFRAAAAELTGPDLAAHYQREKADAPRRRDAGKRYLQPHSGKPPQERRKSQDVLHLGAALMSWCRKHEDGLAMPDEGSIHVLDWGVPLKSAAADRALGDADPNKGVERLDLLGIGPEDRLALGFLKYLESDATRTGTGDTPLRALLLALAHAAIADANRVALLEEVEATYGRRWSDAPPLVLVAATPRYWELCRKREAQKGAAWINEMERLAREIDEQLGVRVEYLGLRLQGELGWSYGDEGPVLDGPARFDPAWPPGAGKVRPKPRPRPKATPSEPELVEPDLSRPVRSYAISESYQAGDRIEHPTLGLGVVQRIAGAGKIEVLFEERPSLLIHERPTASAAAAPPA